MKRLLLILVFAFPLLCLGAEPSPVSITLEVPAAHAAEVAQAIIWQFGGMLSEEEQAYPPAKKVKACLRRVILQSVKRYRRANASQTHVQSIQVDEEVITPPDS